MAQHENISDPELHSSFSGLGRVCRVGLATRGNTHLEPEWVIEAIDRGVNYLNWCGVGHSDGLTAAVRQLGARREEVYVAAQFFAREGNGAREELDEILEELNSDYIDVLTFYYVESQEEWDAIMAPGGAMDCLRAAQQDKKVRCIGLSSHQRSLAAGIAARGQTDVLMVRYNAAHRGAEKDVFPVTQAHGIPVVTYTGLHWGALLNSTTDDPAGFVPPGASQWYRFVLCHSSVTVGLVAPNGYEELQEDLALLDDRQGLSRELYEALKAHGDRVYRHGGAFP